MESRCRKWEIEQEYNLNLNTKNVWKNHLNQIFWNEKNDKKGDVIFSVIKYNKKRQLLLSHFMQEFQL